MWYGELTISRWESSAQRRGDLLEVEMAGISSEAEKKIDRIKEEAKRRVSEYERTTKHAQDDLEKVSELLSAAKSGNRRHESQVRLPLSLSIFRHPD